MVRVLRAEAEHSPLTDMLLGDDNRVKHLCAYEAMARKQIKLLEQMLAEHNQRRAVLRSPPLAIATEEQAVVRPANTMLTSAKVAGAAAVGESATLVSPTEPAREPSSAIPAAAIANHEEAIGSTGNFAGQQTQHQKAIPVPTADMTTVESQNEPNSGAGGLDEPE